VGEVSRVSEREGEAFVANFPLATNKVWRDKEGEEVRRTEWHRIVYLYGTFISTTYLRVKLLTSNSQLKALVEESHPLLSLISILPGTGNLEDLYSGSLF